MSRGENVLKNSNDDVLRLQKVNDEMIPFLQIWQEMV